MGRTGVRALPRVASIVLLAGAVLVGGRAARGAGDSRPTVPAAERHVVSAGDTLWGIARARVGPTADPRPLVEAIRSANGIRPGGLRPGMELRVPAVP